MIRDQQGLSLLELVLVVAIITVLITTFVLITRPAEYKSKARDNRRLADLSTLDRAISEYFIDVGEYPDIENMLRTSTTLPAENPGPVEHISNGWIDADLSVYMSKLPIDPINDETFFYSYQWFDTAYEINARLEYYTEYMQNDGGSDEAVYEVGSDLTIL